MLTLKRSLSNRSFVEVAFINVAILLFALQSPYAGYHLVAAYLIESIVIGLFAVLNLLYKGVVDRRPLLASANIAFFMMFFLGVTVPFLMAIGVATGDLTFSLETKRLLDTPSSFFSGLFELFWVAFSEIASYVYESFRWLVLLFLFVHGYEWVRGLSLQSVAKSAYTDLAIPIVKRILLVIGWSYVLFFFIIAPFTIEQTSGWLGTAEKAELTNLISTALLIFLSTLKLLLELFIISKRKSAQVPINPTPEIVRTAEEKTIPIKF